jgi:putative membrane protein insertion efficiency factor
LSTLVLKLLVIAVEVYRHSLAYFLGGRCRFQPSCSLYAREALLVHGPWRGFALAVRRLGRCHPWHPAGFDPVPAAPPSAALPRRETGS